MLNIKHIHNTRILMKVSYLASRAITLADLCKVQTSVVEGRWCSSLKVSNFDLILLRFTGMFSSPWSGLESAIKKKNINYYNTMYTYLENKNIQGCKKNLWNINNYTAFISFCETLNFILSTATE